MYCLSVLFFQTLCNSIGNLVNGFPTPGGVPDQNTFAWTITNNRMPHLQNVFIVEIDWKMLSYAAFFPNVSGGQLYLAQKRPFVPGVASNDPGNPANFANLFNYATSIHTERQLIIAALINSLTQFAVVQEGEQANVIVGGLNIPNAVNGNILERMSQLQGTLHVYTAQNPCQNRTQENGNFSCIDYYNALANFILSLNLHIYFPRNEMRLNKAFFNGNVPACQALCAFVQNNLVAGFQIVGGWLQCKRNEQWK